MDKKKQEEENIKNAKQKEDLIEQKRKETCNYYINNYRNEG